MKLNTNKFNDIYNLAIDLTKTVEHSIKVINILCITSILVMVIIFFQHYNRHKESYYAVSSSNRVTPMQFIEEINVSPDALLNWAMVAVTNAYTLDFLNYEKSLLQISEFFTKQGFEKFQKSMENSNRLKDIINNKLITSAVVVDSPIILREGKLGTSYLWEIQMPIAISYQGASVQVYKQWLAVNLLVKKVPTSEAKKGIGIENLTDVTMGALY
jgi:intracellular multiplication protein IcmL